MGEVFSASSCRISAFFTTQEVFSASSCRISAFLQLKKCFLQAAVESQSFLQLKKCFLQAAVESQSCDRKSMEEYPVTSAPWTVSDLLLLTPKRFYKKNVDGLQAVESLCEDFIIPMHCWTSYLWMCPVYIRLV